MANDIFYLRGSAYWAKVVGAPRKNNFDGNNEWTIDVTPNKEGLALLKKLGVTDRLRDPREGDPRGDNRFLTFKQKEFRADGVTRNDPIKIVDHNNQPWDGKTLIGNDSTVDIKFKYQDYGKGKKPGIYIRGIRVLKLVPYVGGDTFGAPLTEDDEFFAEQPEVDTDAFGLEPIGDNDVADDEDLDDDMPV